MRVLANSEEFRLIEFDSNKNGFSVCIVGGVHGNETSGIKSISKLENELLTENQLLSGKLIMLIANLKAVRLGQRFIDFDLNRAFGNPNAFGHESNLANFLSPYLSTLDYVLDLHSTSASTRPFCAGKLTENHLNLFQMIGFEIYTQGWEVHRQYTMLVDDVYRLGGIGIIAECGKTDECQTDKVAYSAVIRLLEALGMLKPSTSAQIHTSINLTIIHINQIIKAKTNCFSFTRHFENFELVNAYEVVACDGYDPLSYPYNFIISMPTQGSLKERNEAFGIGLIK
ncbi:succinylglutamate desuccinylase/aspartoacylase family protein [Moorena sp. SIO3H5]|uniref:succinylglutamate desuccinylase/aspartoacylase domain-containing protein n=1 Tax=Moorena sp. SIO3H5 TaxID=2607834 RepID=UPI0013B9304E|nr:succinylglutamate desuccinylase/aspartoacylase family protein [Moorena sp. SIO3H5]NEO71342.1 hypothetical protein [Moorena sp. SIO3H5]